MERLAQCGKEGRRLEKSEVDSVLASGKTLFFGNRLCPYAHVAWWSLLEKNVAFEYIHVDLGPHKPDWYKAKVSPYGTVPALYDEGHGIFESALIAEYIEEKWGPTRGTRLLPADPYDRAAVRLVVAHFRERTLPPLYRLLKAQTPAEAKLAKEQILVEMLAFEKLYAKHTPSHGPYFLGETFSLAEICVFPFLERLCLALQHYRGLNPLQDAHLPRLQEAFEHVHDRQAFKSTSQLPAFYVAVYESYAHPASCTATTGAACVGKGKTHLGWRVASWLSVAGATLPVVSILSFGTFLLGVGMGWSKARAQGRAGGHLTMG